MVKFTLRKQSRSRYLWPIVLACSYLSTHFPRRSICRQWMHSSRIPLIGKTCTAKPFGLQPKKGCEMAARRSSFSASFPVMRTLAETARLLPFCHAHEVMVHKPHNQIHQSKGGWNGNTQSQGFVEDNARFVDGIEGQFE